MSDFIAGLDLGQAQDFTALVIAERHWEAGGCRYEVRHLQRWPLGTGYPAIVAEVTALMRRQPLWPSAPLIVDQTGVGRAVVDMFRLLGRRLIPVTITAGQEAAETPDGWKTPKRDLVGVVQVLLQQQRLKVADALPEADLLVKELLGFQVKITDAANDVYGAWREGAHDDLVLALALAAWYGELKPVNPLAGMIVHVGVRSAWANPGAQPRNEREVAPLYKKGRAAF